MVRSSPQSCDGRVASALSLPPLGGERWKGVLMASRRTVVTECDRCPANKRKPATDRIKMPVGDSEYELELCSTHHNELDRVLYSWARLGREIEKDLPRVITPESREDARRLAVLRSTQYVREAVPARPRRAMHVTGEALVGLPDDAGDWIFSDHAVLRLRERKISAVQALRAACLPEIRREGKTDDTLIHVAGGIWVVVKDEQKVIVTVAHEGEATWTGAVINNRRMQA